MLGRSFVITGHLIVEPLQACLRGTPTLELYELCIVNETVRALAHVDLLAFRPDFLVNRCEEMEKLNVHFQGSLEVVSVELLEHTFCDFEELRALNLSLVLAQEELELFVQRSHYFEEAGLEVGNASVQSLALKLCKLRMEPGDQQDDSQLEINVSSHSVLNLSVSDSLLQLQDSVTQ